jgi:hypothetical protein
MFRIDVIELVHDRVQLGHPGLGVFVETPLARSLERLIAEPGQRKRHEVLHRPCADRHNRRLGDEPFRAAGDASARAVAPEVVSRLARRKAQGMAGGESAFGLRTAEPREHEHVRDINERQRRHARHDILHQHRQRFRVINHAQPLNTDAVTCGAHAPSGLARRGHSVYIEIGACK